MKLVEMYPSIQGEGPRTGLPIQFVRFGGCNMTCPGWPCDTQFAIDRPKYGHLWKSVRPEELIDRIPDYPRRVCLTGGEPLLQPSREMEQLATGLLHRSFQIDVFTNGSRPLPAWARDSAVAIVMDWKLEGSGEAETGLDMRRANAKELGKKDAIKFVCKNQNDLAEATLWTERLYAMGVNAPLWAGVAWGGELTDSALVEYILETSLPWRLNVQLHNHIWPPQERGR